MSTLTKETLTLDDEDLAERLLIKLVESICYHYLLEKPVVVTAQIIWEVIIATTRFAEGSAPHIVFAEIKRREEKEWASGSIFSSFLEKLGKGKGYVPVEDLTQVDNLNQTFKVFEGKAFDKEIHTFADTSDILGLLSGRESPELERVNWVTKDYNLCSRSKSSEVTRTMVSDRRRRIWKVVPPPVVSLLLPPVALPLVPPMNQPLILTEMDTELS